MSEPHAPDSESTDESLAVGEDLEIERLARERRLVRGLRVAARRALVLARRYREEEGPRGERETACVAQALAWRAAAKSLRGRPLSELGPGIVRALAPRAKSTRAVV